MAASFIQIQHRGAGSGTLYMLFFLFLSIVLWNRQDDPSLGIQSSKAKKLSYLDKGTRLVHVKAKIETHGF